MGSEIDLPVELLPSDAILVQERRKRYAASKPPSFGRWLEQKTPEYRWDWPYSRLIQSRLEALLAGVIKRLMIIAPPRHGKSEMATVRFPVFALDHDQRRRVIVGCYGHELAAYFTRSARRLARTCGLLAESEIERAYEWETSAGGGMRACGVGSGVTGRGGDLVVIDDPVKSAEEAASLAYRDRVWDWYLGDILTRREPGAGMLLIQTRWHEDDLAGRILASESAHEWEVLRLPAASEGDGDPLGRPEGEPLCPDRFDVQALAEIRRESERVWQALYQGRPTAREGAFFRADRIGVVDVAPAGLRRVRAWDLAASDGSGNYSAGVLLAGPDADRLWYILDVVRGRWEPSERNARILQTAQADGQEVRIRLPEDPGSGGKEAARTLVGALAGFSAIALRVTGSKEVRAEPLAAQVNAGMLRLVRAPWNRDMLEELRAFPSGANDDQVDALSDAFSSLARLPAAVGATPDNARGPVKYPPGLRPPAARYAARGRVS